MNDVYLRPPRLSLPVSTLLPRDARDRLVAAAGVEPSAPAGESVIRTRLLDEAIAKVKRKYPHLFR